MMLHSLPLIGYTGTTMNEGILFTKGYFSRKHIRATTAAKCKLSLYLQPCALNFMLLTQAQNINYFSLILSD